MAQSETMERVSEEARVTLRELLGRVPAVPPVQEFLDARLVTVGQGEAVVSMQAHRGMHNVIGVVHGGVLTSLAELAASGAMITVAEEDESFTFTNQTTNYLRPVVDGTVEARARVARKGGRISLVEVVLTDEVGQEVGRATFTTLSQRVQRPEA